MKNLLISLSLILLVNTASSQTDIINITGKIDSSILQSFNSSELLIKIHDPIKKFLNQERIIPATVNQNGFFSTMIKPISSLTYLSFWVKNNNRNSGITRVHHPFRQIYLDEMYLFETGDSIHIDILKEGKLHFSGKGNEKLNCQFRIYDTSIKPSSIKLMITSLLNEKQYDKALDFERVALDMALSLRLKILNNYKGKFSDSVYNMIYLDAISSAEYESLYPLWNKALQPLKVDYEEAKISIQDFFTKYWLKAYANTNNRPLITESAYFIEYLFEREWNTYKLFSTNLVKGDSFKGIYEQIKQKYDGKVRDQLLLVCLRKLNRYFPDEIKLYIKDAAKTAGEKAYKIAIELWSKKYGAAYPFEFEDENSKVHRLSDYRGKLIVLDFWFTGCLPCIELNAAMHSIVESYKNNNDIVFITVCEDRNKEQWVKSLISGKYTSPGTINLYTNGLGTNHPMLKYYNFMGAPQQLIIDKKGNLITLNAPHPNNEINRNKFIKLINDHLE